MEYCISLRLDHNFSVEESIMAYEKLIYYITFQSDTIEVILKNNKIDKINGIVIHNNRIALKELEDVKMESIYEIPDQVSHYCKRYLLRISKLKQPVST
jgi:hypothetical protein